ncbi:hypothetical protein L4C33_21800 [Vibrio makurazakiensis]|uniref:DUF6614 family protein n=1 Tax=Vibrio makurazakiensis TaxID=2910250 RepID=UPI003D13A43C
MKTYNVFYTVKDGVDEYRVLRLTHEFAELLLNDKLIESAAVHKVANQGNFEEMPNYHMAVNFRDQRQMDDAFKIIRDRYMVQPPHSELMSSVTEFKVTFTERTESREYM